MKNRERVHEKVRPAKSKTRFSRNLCVIGTVYYVCKAQSLPSRHLRGHGDQYLSNVWISHSQPNHTLPGPYYPPPPAFHEERYEKPQFPPKANRQNVILNGKKIGNHGHTQKSRLEGVCGWMEWLLERRTSHTHSVPFE